MQVYGKKKKIRARLLKKRNSLKPSERNKRSFKIKSRLRSLPVYKKAKVVMFFVTHGSEVRTKEMIEQAWKDLKKVAAPAANLKKCSLSASIISSFKKHLRPGAYGILEPNPETCLQVTSKSIDIVFVPAIAFDVHGHRLGYGKGYFDSWLKNIPLKKRVGLAFDFQILKKLPVTKNDVRVKTIITENRVIECKKR